MNVGDPARDRILDRDHGEFSLAVEIAAKASSKVAQGSGSVRIVLGEAIWEFAPGSP